MEIIREQETSQEITRSHFQLSLLLIPKMVVVALAGATSGFGLTLLHIFQDLNRTSTPPNQHELVVLSRSARPELIARGIDVRIADYTSHEKLVAVLQGVHTVLSTISGQGLGASQLALLEAAKAAGVRRFAPSEFAGEGYTGIDLYAPKAVVWEATRASGLEYTRFNCGLFMSVLATGTPKPVTEEGRREGRQSGEEEALAGLRPWNYVVNVRAGTADLPGDGTAPMVLTDMRDVAKFVWRALSLPSWPENLGMRGDVKSWREIVAILEKVQGRKFLIQETRLEELEEGAKQPQLRFYNQTRIAIAKAWGMVSDELNHASPDVKPITTEEFVEKWWSGVDLPAPAWTENKAFGASDF